MTRRHFQSSNRQGFTLLEVLIVMALMAMVASVACVSLGSADDASRVMRVLAQVKELHIRGRLLAQTSGEVATITLTDEPPAILLRSGANLEIVSQIALPVGVNVRFEDHHQLTQIIIDRFGHSVDYSAFVQSHGNTTRLKVNGLTARVQRMEAGS